jgi:AcrR family transcriptional regulator
MNRKEAILQAAIELFAEKGFEATPTSEVAKRAGVAEGTIFHHFRSKDDVIVLLFEQMADIYLEGMEEVTKQAESGLDGVEAIIRFHFRFSDERSKESLVLIRDFPLRLFVPGSRYLEVIKGRLMRLMAAMEGCIELGKKDGSIRDVPTKEAVFMIRGILNGLARFRLLGAVKPPEIVDEVVDFCRRGLQSSPDIRK